MHHHASMDPDLCCDGNISPSSDSSFFLGRKLCEQWYGRSPKIVVTDAAAMNGAQQVLVEGESTGEDSSSGLPILSVEKAMGRAGHTDDATSQNEVTRGIASILILLSPPQVCTSSKS